MRLMSSEHEQDIEKTLSALGAVKPSPGFESRVLRGLEERATEPGLGRNAGGYSSAFRIATAFGACLAVILAFTVFAHRRAHRGDLGQIRSRPASSPRVSPGLAEDRVVLQNGVAGTAVSKSAAVSEGLRPRVLLQAVRTTASSASAIPVRLEIEAHAVTVASSRELDAQAAEDFRAASSPAPPLPLTAQERLVRLMLRRGEKHDLAQLDPAQTAAFIATEQAAFQTFFDPAPPPKPQGDVQ